MKTAVEWFFNEIDKTYWDYMTVEQQQHIFKQAKEMEQQQIIEAANWGALSETGERYYEDNYIADDRKQKSVGKNI